jgi:hypothetical protein
MRRRYSSPTYRSSTPTTTCGWRGARRRERSPRGPDRVRRVPLRVPHRRPRRAAPGRVRSSGSRRSPRRPDRRNDGPPIAGRSTGTASTCTATGLGTELSGRGEQRIWRGLRNSLVAIQRDDDRDQDRRLEAERDVGLALTTRHGTALRAMFPLPAPMLAGSRAILGVSREVYHVRTRGGRSIEDRLGAHHPRNRRRARLRADCRSRTPGRVLRTCRCDRGPPQ